MRSINPYIQEAKFIPNRMNEHLSHLIQIFKNQRLKKKKIWKVVREKKDPESNKCDTNYH